MEDDEMVPVNMTLPASLAVASLRAANAAGLSRSELVRRLLSGYLAETEH